MHANVGLVATCCCGGCFPVFVAAQPPQMLESMLLAIRAAVAMVCRRAGIIHAYGHSLQGGERTED